MTDPALPHVLDRTLTIRARPATVFAYFTDSGRWAAWWGEGSTIEPRPGGEVRIRYPNGIEAGGRVLAIEPPERIVFSFGYASGEPMPLGASRVTIELAAVDAGTRLALRHELADATLRDQHVQGWRYQLALFANAVADAQLAGLDATIDAWFALWSEPDAGRRAEILDAVVTPQVRMRDRWSAVDGRDDLAAHLEAIQRFAPGARAERTGAVRHCQSTAIADWRARRGETPMGGGTNVFRLDADGRIEEVVGLWSS
jgi:uncharacterized protein YndB with AHSA1/START domain